MKPEFLTLYGKRYARNSRGVVASLFQSGGTANGTFRTTKAGIYFHDMQGQERAFLRRDGVGPVTVSRLDDGRRWYVLAGLCERERQWMNEPESYSARVEGARALAREVFQP